MPENDNTPGQIAKIIAITVNAALIVFSIYSWIRLIRTDMEDPAALLIVLAVILFTAFAVIFTLKHYWFDQWL